MPRRKKMASSEGSFKLKKITSFKDLIENPNAVIQESDLCFQNNDYIAQFAYQEPKVPQKKKIKPGIFTMVESSGYIHLEKIELREKNILTSIVNTKAILNEANTFFRKLDVYKRRGWQPKRGVLLYSAPGLGKSVTIAKFCSDAVKEDPGSVIIMWPTSAVEAHSVVAFFGSQTEYSKECTRVIMVIEDIGGGDLGVGGMPRPVPASLLNFLDGIDVVFRKPTFIIATTNHPQNLLASLADRPGRFDLMMELKSPSPQEKIALVEFIAKRSISEDEKQLFYAKDAADLSIAHLEEIVVRSELHDISLADSFKQLTEHRQKFKNAFEDVKAAGFGPRYDDDD